MYKRKLDLTSLTEHKSILLFGPRSTGKSTLIRQLFPTTSVINLLKQDIFLKLKASPQMLREIVREIDGLVVIDEIQKIPELLDEIHNLIEEENRKFLLTGSSARKLKRSGMNLLGGRAWQANLFPLVSSEIGEIVIDRVLTFGLLPQVYTSNSPWEELDAYINTYLKEEIREEAAVQNLSAFSRFLKVAALTSSQLVNYANISSDTGIAASTVKNYYQILHDTLIGIVIEPWRESQKRKAISTSKFYFFDTGVTNFLRGHDKINKDSSEYGELFEQFIAMELRAYLSYFRIKKELNFWRTKNQIEVDFLIEEHFAVEVKATSNLTNKHFTGLVALSEEEKFRGKKIIVSLDPVNRVVTKEIHCMHWKDFLNALWAKKFMP